MITDQQFIEAMEQAVKIKGGEHIARATYRSDAGPDCIVGFALSLIGDTFCPQTNKIMAQDLLPTFGVSEHVAKAAFAAQVLNDREFAWKYVLDGFRYALTLGGTRTAHDVAFMVSELAMMRRMMDAEDRLKEAKATATATGGTLVTANTLTACMCMACYPINWNGTSSTANSLPAISNLAVELAALTAKVAKKTDHALTA